MRFGNQALQSTKSTCERCGSHSVLTTTSYGAPKTLPFFGYGANSAVASHRQTHHHEGRHRVRSHLGSRHGTRRLVLPRDFFDFPMDAASLVIILHGELLHSCSSVVQEHFQGLAQAGRYLRSAGLVSPKDARKLRMIDDCCALVRHITTVSSAQTVKDLKDKISCAIPAHERHHSRRDIVPAATYAATTAEVIDHVIADFPGTSNASN